jgi:myo-inositol-1(or 4)-monophosphatase
LPESDLDLLRNAAIGAGKIAMRFYQKNPISWDKGDGQGPVSEADLEIDKMLFDFLSIARPNYSFLSEEAENNTDRYTTKNVFIIDPIDGTKSFLNGHENFATSIAVARNGVIHTAVVYLPAKDLLYDAQKDEGSRLNGVQIHTGNNTNINGARILASESQSNPKLWKDTPPPIERHFRSSLAYRLCLVAEGRFDGMMTLRPTWEWDVAAGNLICTEAGCEVRTQEGECPIYNSEDSKMNGMIAGNSILVNKLLGYIK